MASSTIGTNVVPDEQELMRLIESVMAAIERKYLSDDENKKKMKLMNELKTHVKLGGKIGYNVIPSKFSNKVVEMLENQNIPYMAIPDGSGNMMVMVKDSDKDKLLEIQKDIEMLSTDYVKELTPQNILDLYKAHGIKNVDSLTFKNKDMAEIAKQKLYQSGVTFAEVERENSVELIVSPMSKFSKTGDDLACFELYHSFEQSKADDMFKKDPSETCTDLLKTRFIQAKYDKKELETFAQSIKIGRNGILCSLSGEQSICIEKNDLGVFVLEKQNEGGITSWKSTELQIDSDASVKDISALLSRYTESIRDMSIVNKDFFDSIKDVKLAANDPKVASIKKRPDNNCVSREAGKVCQVIKREMDTVIEAINHEATRQVNASIGTSVVSQEASYQMKKDAIENIIRARSIPELQSFVSNSSQYMSSDDKEKWLDNILEHFTNTHENTEYSCDFVKTDIKQFAKDLSKEMDQSFMQNAEEVLDV